MDSLTQLTLGAAVGEAVLGHRVGRKAAAWGALFGTLPDLDVLAAPFLDEVAELAFHRGITHAFAFDLVLAPVLGLMLARLHVREGVSWQGWAGLAFLCLFTHPLLDCLTVYGTQILQPFSDYPVAYPAVFIIDFFYTLPLLFGLLVALLLRRDRRAVRWANYVGLGLSTAYLMLAVFNKQLAERAFETALAHEGLSDTHLLTTPMPLNTVLWMGMARQQDTLYVGLHSLLAPDVPITFQRVPQHTQRIAPYLGQRAIDRLMWFARGYYTVEERGEEMVFNDLRFGRSDGWLSDQGSFLFSFYLEFEDPARTQVTGFNNRPPSVDDAGASLALLWQRIWGPAMRP